MNYYIRKIEKKDQAFLYDMLYQAIYIEPGSKPIKYDILNLPEIKKYVDGWGKKTDYGFLAVEVETEKKIGAAWLRLIKGYGYINNDIPPT